MQDGCRGASLSFACDRVIEYGSGVQLVAHLTAIYIHQRAVDLARGGKPAPKLPPFLTRREQEVLQWTGSGKTAAETGQILGCTARTIEHHLIKAREKLGVATSRQAAAVAVRHGLVAVPEAGR